jgi:hypothetical protein
MACPLSVTPHPIHLDAKNYDDYDEFYEREAALRTLPRTQKYRWPQTCGILCLVVCMIVVRSLTVGGGAVSS